MLVHTKGFSIYHAYWEKARVHFIGKSIIVKGKRIDIVVCRRSSQGDKREAQDQKELHEGSLRIHYYLLEMKKKSEKKEEKGSVKKEEEKKLEGKKEKEEERKEEV